MLNTVEICSFIRQLSGIECDIQSDKIEQVICLELLVQQLLFTT